MHQPPRLNSFWRVRREHLRGGIHDQDHQFHGVTNPVYFVGYVGERDPDAEFRTAESAETVVIACNHSFGFMGTLAEFHECFQPEPTEQEKKAA